MNIGKEKLIEIQNQFLNGIKNIYFNKWILRDIVHCKIILKNGTQ